MKNPEDHLGPGCLFKSDRRFLWVYGFALIMLFGSLAVICSFGPALRFSIFIENGPVESMSAAGYFICIALMFICFGKEARRYWHVIVVLAAMGMRELDFNSRFTAMSVTKIKFYLSPEMPFHHKFIAAACALLVLYCLVCLLVRNWRGFLNSLRKHEPYALFVATGLGFLLASVTLDGLGGKLMKLGIFPDKNWIEWAENAEEMLELWIPVMFTLGLRYFWAERHRKC